MNWGAPTAATYGLTGTTFPNWSAAGTDSCVRANHVLCFQQ
jgi:hypothetical protein